MRATSTTSVPPTLVARWAPPETPALLPQPPSTGDSWGTAGRARRGLLRRRAGRCARFAGSPWPAKHPGRAVAARTGAQPRGALAPRPPRLQIGSKGSWAPGSKCLKLRRARETFFFQERASSGVLTQSLPGYFSHIATVSLQRGGSAFRKLARALLSHVFGTRRGQLSETSFSRRGKSA